MGPSGMMVTGSQTGFPQSKYPKITKGKLLLAEPQKSPGITATAFCWLQASHKSNPDLKGEQLQSTSSEGNGKITL